jgi:hypothetical protein
MAQAPNYTPSEDFSQDELNNAGGRSAILTEALDDELSAISTAHNALNTNVQLNQRDDGEIRDQRVKLHTLDPVVLKLVSMFGGVVRGAWMTATAYAIKDVVTQGGNTYVAAVAHTSGVFATDLAAVRWVLVQVGVATAASGIPFTPTATLAATNVQAAIDESDTENRALTVAEVANRVAADALLVQIAALADTAVIGSGDAMVGIKRTAAGAIAITLHDANEKRIFDLAADFGVTTASSAAATKTALQLAITAAGATSRGGWVIVPPFLNYGLIVTDKTTWPSFAGLTVPVVVHDYSQASSYAGYPTAYDGAQYRSWQFTPQTTSPGQHDGNTVWQRGAWAPNYCISNDMDLSGGRLATDNRRARYTIFNEGRATWSIGQGSNASSTLTSEELSNFIIEKYSAAGDTLGGYFSLVVERKTGRQSWGGGTNAPLAHFDLAPSNPADTGVPVCVIRTSGSTTAGVEIQSSSGAGLRSFLRNVSGNTEIGTTTGGTAFKQRQADGFTEIGAGTSFTYHFNVQAARASNWISFVNNTNATDGFVQRLQSTSVQASTWSFLEGYANAGADLRVRVRGDGNVYNVNNIFAAISDEKLKRDIADAGSAWADFKAYRFRKYRFKNDPDGALQLGVIAQEIEQVSPGLVSETADFEIDEDGERKLTGTVTKEVKYSILYLKAAVALQEAMVRIEALEARLNKLEKAS